MAHITYVHASNKACIQIRCKKPSFKLCCAKITPDVKVNKAMAYLRTRCKVLSKILYSISIYVSVCNSSQTPQYGLKLKVLRTVPKKPLHSNIVALNACMQYLTSTHIAGCTHIHFTFHQKCKRTSK